MRQVGVGKQQLRKAKRKLLEQMRAAYKKKPLRYERIVMEPVYAFKRTHSPDLAVPQRLMDLSCAAYNSAMQSYTYEAFLEKLFMYYDK